VSLAADSRIECGRSGRDRGRGITVYNHPVGAVIDQVLFYAG
jgi:hypothetical protein